MLAQWSVLVGWTEPAPPFAASPSVPTIEKVTVHESSEDDALVWRVPMMGFRRRDVDVTAHGAQLRIRGARTKGFFSPTHTVVETALQIPAAVDPVGIQASLDGGVLTLRLPKRPEAKRRRVPIRYDGQQTLDAPGEQVALPERWPGRALSWCQREWRQLRGDLARLLGRDRPHPSA